MKLRFSDDCDGVIEDVIKMCDVALMMGAPVLGRSATTAAAMATKLSKYLTEKSDQVFQSEVCLLILL
jgi:hypothetical protein